jgi:hypothetical protein
MKSFSIISRLPAVRVHFTYEGADPVVVGKIKEHYSEIKAGIGLKKSPLLYGAFPTDPYSHTPANAGAQQPGMTGQVKEDFISRMRELGVHVRNGEIMFHFNLINPDEFLDQERPFEYFDLNGVKQQIQLNKGQLAFTFCQVPVLYNAWGDDQIIIKFSDAKQLLLQGHVINEALSSKIFQRSGEIIQIEVSIKNLVKQPDLQTIN